jgi:hypothetical protein
MKEFGKLIPEATPASVKKGQELVKVEPFTYGDLGLVFDAKICGKPACKKAAEPVYEKHPHLRNLGETETKILWQNERERIIALRAKGGSVKSKQQVT